MASAHAKPRSVRRSITDAAHAVGLTGDLWDKSTAATAESRGLRAVTHTL